MEAKSLGDILRRSVAKHGPRTAFLIPEGTEFRPLTYDALFLRVQLYAGALRGMGLRRGDRLVIFSENCAEWAITDWACQCLGIVVVPIYPTLPANQAAYIVQDSAALHAVVGSVELSKKLEGIDRLNIRLIKGEPNSLDHLADRSADEISLSGLNAEIDGGQLADLATIIYTSGTTGVPKGVMLSHRAIIHVCEAVGRINVLNTDDNFLSFLPQSHVYERVAGQILPIALGAKITYIKNLASMAGAMTKVQPTVMMCVPRFLESFRDRILDAVAKQPAKKQRLFHLALSQGVKRAQGKFAPLALITDRLVMHKIRERAGGKMRYFISGGAALAPNVAEFYMATGLTVLQGYGLTETTGGTFLNLPNNNKYWTVGEPLEMESRIAPDGEILIRGPGLMTGYFNLPDETEAAIDLEGWFHTGDIGEFEGKSLKITDRKKDLLVLGNGKNIAPQPIESKLRTSEYISEAVLLGDGMDSCFALIVPNHASVIKLLNLSEGELLSSNEGVRKLIKREIDVVNKTLANFEIIKRFTILDNVFSIESGELTPTMKVKRKVIKERYASEIESMK